MKKFLLLFFAAFLFQTVLLAQDLERVKTLTAETEQLIEDENFDEALEKLQTINNILGNLQGKPLELYKKAKAGKERKKQEQKDAENRARYESLIKEGDDYLELGYYAKAMEKYLAAKELLVTDEVNSKIEKVNSLQADETVVKYDEIAAKAEVKSDYATAVYYYKEAEKLKPDSERKRKIEAFQKIIDEYSREAEAGQAQYRKSNYPAAKKHFIKCKKLLPTQIYPFKWITFCEVFQLVTESDSMFAITPHIKTADIQNKLNIIGTMYDTSGTLFTDLPWPLCFTRQINEALVERNIIEQFNKLSIENEVLTVEEFYKYLSKDPSASGTKIPRSIESGSYGYSTCEKDSIIKFQGSVSRVHSERTYPGYTQNLIINDLMRSYFLRYFFTYYNKPKPNPYLNQLSNYAEEYSAGFDKNPVNAKPSEFVTFADSIIQLFNQAALAQKQLHQYDSAIAIIEMAETLVEGFDEDFKKLYRKYAENGDPKIENGPQGIAKVFNNLPSLKTMLELYVQCELKSLESSMHWKFEGSVPYAAGSATTRDLMHYSAAYTTKMGNAINEQGYDARTVTYKNPVFNLQLNIRYNNEMQLGGRRFLPWGFDFGFQALAGRKGTGVTDNYKIRKTGDPANMFPGDVISTANTNLDQSAYRQLTGSANVHFDLFKYLRLQAGLSYLRLNYNAYFPCATCGESSQFMLSRVGPVVGIGTTDIHLGNTFRISGLAENFSMLYHNEKDLQVNLPADARRQPGIFNLKPIAYRLGGRLDMDQLDWGMALQYQIFRSSVNYLASTSPYTSYFRGINYNQASLIFYKNF